MQRVYNFAARLARRSVRYINWCTSCKRAESKYCSKHHAAAVYVNVSKIKGMIQFSAKSVTGNGQPAMIHL